MVYRIESFTGNIVTGINSREEGIELFNAMFEDGCLCDGDALEDELRRPVLVLERSTIVEYDENFARMD